MPSLYRRDWEYGWNSSGGARWAFFAIFVVLIVIVVLGTIRVNRKRSQQGLQPIHGTRWMTPPLYYQLQRNENSRRRDPEGSAFVPAYTEEVNDNDMGYYDRDGVFRPTKHPDDLNTDLAEGTVPLPNDVHRRLTVNTDGVPLQDFAPPPGPPPPDINEASYRAPKNTLEFYEDHEFYRPVRPPMGASAPEGEGLSTQIIQTVDTTTTAPTDDSIKKK